MRRLAIGLVVLAACASDGTELRAPPPGASAPPLTTTTTVPASAPAPLVLVSVAFDNGGSIPKQYTCEDANISPPLQWGAVPEGTAELVITVTDTDANGFVHWVVAGIDPGVQAIPEGTLPVGAIETANDSGTIGWTGPCPPPGLPHHYVFNLYALTSSPGVIAGMPGRDAILAVENVPGILATFTGLYQRV